MVFAVGHTTGHLFVNVPLCHNSDTTICIIAFRSLWTSSIKTLLTKLQLYLCFVFFFLSFFFGSFVIVNHQRLKCSCMAVAVVLT